MLFLVLTISISGLHVFGQLYVQRAGLVSLGVMLQDGLTICPADYIGGLTIRCDASPRATRATFLVNGYWVHTERVAPFFIAGDVKGTSRAWYSYPAEATILCSANDGSRLVAFVVFACPWPSSRPMSSYLPIYTPLLDIPETLPYATLVASKQAHYLSSSASLPEIKKVRIGCVVLYAIDASAVSEQWSRAGSALGFKLNDASRTITRQGMAPLTYKFKPLQAGRHAIAIDMSSRGKKDYSDVWVRFHRGGFELKDDNQLKPQNRVRSWFRVSHGHFGRSLATRSTGGSGWSLSTKAFLRKDTTYYLEISGCSNQVIVHRIILFPCSEIECNQLSSKFTTNLANCSS